MTPKFSQFQVKAYLRCMQKFSSLRLSVQELCRGQNLVSSIHTYIHTFFKNLLFWLRNLKNIEIHQNLYFKNCHRYKAFSLRKQYSVNRSKISILNILWHSVREAWFHTPLNEKACSKSSFVHIVSKNTVRYTSEKVHALESKCTISKQRKY